jgi:HAMP domain-containing protein
VAVHSDHAGSLRAVAEDAAIRNALVSRAASLGAARAALRRLSTFGRIRASADRALERDRASPGTGPGTDSGETIGLNIPAEESEPESIHGRGLDSLRIVDSVQIGELQRVGARTLFWVVMPVRDGDKLLGFVARRQHIGSNPQTEATIRELSGNSAAGYYRNADGSVWTTFGGFPEAPADSTISSKGGRGERIRSAAGGRLLFTEGRVAGTPLVLGMEAPRATILTVPNATARQLALLGVMLTLVGALITWFVGRRVLRPLTELTSAADSVASGDYSTRVPTAGTEGSGRVWRRASTAWRSRSATTESCSKRRIARNPTFLASMSHVTAHAAQRDWRLR